ncbi:TetR family transcriptional regulator [Nocardioides zeae]|uniref:TetR family transcriptional regulator n=1 Tax=Nocardioides imazamoxiresistens TaxID=3231893 RepID=A0ABU3PWH0_9ACTN|nr:TetR family transcriptional regulator [Nocardioides zeae]MDT9593100.1 TetR family transcriptional regulator [Nocardioides zeae]
MSPSADNPTSSGRAGKREETATRIMLAAQQLAADRGLDGFTMDELADAAGVSRRTLFNYFPSKVDACLGPPLGLPEEAVAAFRAGGPTGVLSTDLEHVARAVLTYEQPSRDELLLHRRLFQIPRLVEASHERFVELAGELQDAMQERDGGQPTDPATALLAVRLLVLVFDTALDASIAGDDTPLPDLFSRYLATARSLLA